jgi:hypothetical protein
MDAQEMEQNLKTMYRKFRRACSYLRWFNSAITDTNTRYLRAKRDNQRSFRYNLRLKIATLEGVRNAYHEYACQTGTQINELKHQLTSLKTAQN